MATARESYTATALLDGRVLIVGGFDRPTYLASAEVFDPKTGSFSPTGSMAAARMFDAATAFPDGRVLIVGGVGGGYARSTYLASAELYDPKTGSFSPTDSMTTARTDPTATVLSDGRVLIAGGGNGSTSLASAELYQP
jgi:hypothetical protein